MAEAFAATRIFVNLPSYSRLLGQHLVYYDGARPGDNCDIVEHYLRSPGELDAIAGAGMEEVARAHTLALRLEKIIGDAASPTRQ